AEAPASGDKPRSAPDERVSGTMAPAEAGEAVHEPTHGTHSEAVMAETVQHEETAEPVDTIATASEGESAEAVHHDLRTWLTPAAIQSPAGDEFALPHQPEFSTEGEFALPPHQHEPSMDSVLDLEHEVPNAPASDDIASSTSEPDYLSEARRLAREAHEQVTREHGLHANFEKMKEQA